MAPAVDPQVTAAIRAAEAAEESAAVRTNRQRAVRLCVAPGVVAGVVVLIVLVAVGLPVVGVVGLVVVASAVAALLWRQAPGAILRSFGARASQEWERPRLHNLVDGLCATMGLAPPAIYVVDSEVPNAMALGRSPAAACLVVTSGLEAALTLVELEGVLAHELVHIKRQDTVLAGVAVVTTGVFAVVAGVPWGVSRVHRLVGTGRAFDADQRAARVVRYPSGIGSALALMAEAGPSAPPWPPKAGRLAPLTRWLWIDPMVGTSGESAEGNLDDTGVRAATLALG